MGGYLGPDRAAWRAYDATALIEDGARVPTSWWTRARGQLPGGPAQTRAAGGRCDQGGQPLTLRPQDGYDHGYYFVSTFLEDHLRWHAARLKA